jgi:hypothetical protein
MILDPGGVLVGLLASRLAGRFLKGRGEGVGGTLASGSSAPSSAGP